MQKRKSIVVFLCVLVALSAASIARADTPAYGASITAKDNAAGTGPNISGCQAGTTIWLFWTQAPSIDTTIEVKVYAPDGALIKDIAGLHQSDTGTDLLKFTTTQSGVYYIVVIGAYNVVIGTDHVASQSLFVLPESNLGGVAIFAAVFAGFGIFGVYSRRKKPL